MDRYTKIVMTIIAACLAVIAINLTLHNTPSAHAADAPATNPVCEWTYVQDGHGLDIGKDGRSRVEGGWAQLQNDGWRLVTATFAGAERLFYFERCK